MNDTQWLFEYEGLRYAEERKLEEYKAISQYIKKGVISMLGLDLFPIEENIGVDPAGEPITRYRRPEDHEIMPLSVYIGREEIMAEVAKRHQELALQEDAESGEVKEEFVDSDMTPDELDDLFGDSGGESDISFPTDPEEIRKHRLWNSATTQATLKSMFIDKKESDKELEEEFAPSEIRGEKKKARVTID